MSIEQRLNERQIQQSAIEALRKECRSQEEVNALLWAMVKSLREAKNPNEVQ